jgi:REP element-mobilizing transposase RayT
MPAYARKEIVREGEVGIYHCVSRCVRRAYLCGEDPVSGKSFEHRKAWIRTRLEELAGIFGIDVCGYAVMSNHLHVILRIRPDLVAGWSEEDVARRWWRLFPKRRDAGENPAEPYEHELAMLTASAEGLAERRRRLGSLSWFMRCLAEPIARRANREDGCKGRFWEGRFKSQALLDEGAVLACNVYVDLNPVRAGVADRPERSRFTSAYDRIRARRARKRSRRSPSRTRASAKRRGRNIPAEADRDRWLCPIEAERPPRRAGRTSRRSRPITGKSTDPPAPLHRASSQSFLSISLDDYLRLLDWTGRQIRHDKRGAVPSGLSPILERLDVEAECWLEGVRNFGRWFRRAVGRPDHLREEAARSGKHWLQGVGRSRLAFG